MRVSVEGKRGCGWRQPGGLYLVSGDLSEPCPLLPFETTVCPTCGKGIKPARGYTWVDGAKLIPPSEHGTPEHTRMCPLGPKLNREVEGYDGSRPNLPMEDDEGEFVSRIGRCGLIWVGEQHYPTPQEFMREAARMGVSRRITVVPRDFEIGETWVLLGHRKAIERACSEGGDTPGGDSECPVCEGTGFEHRPGIITAFQPTGIEYVVKGDETEEELEALEKRGIEPVQVVRSDEQVALEVD
jgi:hypothetical protein